MVRVIINVIHPFTISPLYLLLLEMRDPELKNKYDYSSVKDEAKKQWTISDTNRKNLLFEVTRLQTAINNNPISKDDFKMSMDAVESYFMERGIDWKTVDNSIIIEGPFDPTPEIVKKVKETTKSLSVTEEAELRKQELSIFRPPTEKTVETVSSLSPIPLVSSSMIKQRQAEIMDASTSSSVAAAASTPKKVSINPEMLNVLNKMFSPVPSSSTSSLTPKKVSITCFDDTKKDDTIESDKSVDNKKTQSKLLQKMINGNAPSSAPPALSNSKLSFLDAIKARKSAE